MFTETLDDLSAAAENKTKLLKSSLGKYLVASLLAGAYLGLGVFLIATIGGMAASIGPMFKIYMGLSFGIALSLVVMTDSELFTGNNMVMLAAALNRKVSVKNFWAISGWSYLGNFIGSVLIALLYVYSGAETGVAGHFLVTVAHAKVSAPALILFLRGALCNILICLAILLSIKLKNEVAKLIMIFWCLYAFVTTGYEHSVVNMIIFTAAKLLDPSTLPITGILYNLIWVTLGNIFGGGLLGAVYYYLGKK